MGKVSDFLASSSETQNISFLLPNNKSAHSSFKQHTLIISQLHGSEASHVWLVSQLGLSQGWHQGAGWAEHSSGGSGEIHFQIHWGYWQNSVHCGCRIHIPTSRLDVSWGPYPAPHSHPYSFSNGLFQGKSAAVCWVTSNLFFFLFFH